MRYLRLTFVSAILLNATGMASAQFQAVNPELLRTSPKFLRAFHSVVAKPSESTVRVSADGKDVALGTVVEADGWILTKWDEIKEKNTIVCKLRDGTEVPAKVIGVKDDYDLALLKIETKDLKPIEWRPSKDARVGRWVASVGTGEAPVAVGVVSVATRPLVLGDQPPKQMNINSGYLGIGLEAGMGGAKVNMVEGKSPAEKAGVKVNDIIYEAAGKAIADHEALINTVGRLRAGDNILLKIKRGEDEIELKATLGKRSGKALGNPQEVMGSELSNRRGGFPFILQHDTVLKPKDCGGPLVDLDGKTVGINIARAGRTESYAIPSEKVRDLLADLKSGKLAPGKTDIGKVEPKVKNPNQVLRVDGKLTDKDLPAKLGEGRFMKVHVVKLKAGETYVIEMDSADIDSYLRLEDANGKKLAEDDDGGGFPNARIVFRASADGDYRIIATTFNVNETGAYTLTVRRDKE